MDDTLPITKKSVSDPEVSTIIYVCNLNFRYTASEPINKELYALRKALRMSVDHKPILYSMNANDSLQYDTR